MSSAKQLLQKIQAISLSRLHSIAKEEIIKEESNLSRIKQDEFERGQRPDGSLIGHYRSPLYAIAKQKKNPFAGGNVDLIDTGSFVESAYLRNPKEGIFTFGFTDSKANDLLNKYDSGENGQQSITNISQKSFNKFQQEIIKPRFKIKLSRELGQR